ncbi:DUF3892 domain-containing protein [Serinibacter arcticus]|uniref:DUF3892 domain-containing protein n=1 Tax=Serinibacter arcticus TaxID=1655435 RepID=UPI0013048F15|nr:DUF3892 domain-containing protein [Serinibacter arcticus]
MHVVAPGTTCEHVLTVRYTVGAETSLRAASREQVHAWITAGNAFATHNARTGASAPVVARTSLRGTRYIATVANGRESDNLLSLPRF